MQSIGLETSVLDSSGVRPADWRGSLAAYLELDSYKVSRIDVGADIAGYSHTNPIKVGYSFEADDDLDTYSFDTVPDSIYRITYRAEIPEFFQSVDFHIYDEDGSYLNSVYAFGEEFFEDQFFFDFESGSGESAYFVLTTSQDKYYTLDPTRIFKYNIDVELINSGVTGGVALSGTAAEYETLTADTSTLADADGLGELTYQWYTKDLEWDWDDEITGATSSTYTLTDDEIGDQVFVRVTYTDGAGREQTVESPISATVVNTNDAPTGSVTISGIDDVGGPFIGDWIYADEDISDADGFPWSGSYQWLRNGEAISGATDYDYDVTADDMGTSLSVRYTYTDDYGTVETVASTPITLNSEPTGGVALSGTTAEHEILTADTSTLADADGLGELTYQWYTKDLEWDWDDEITGATSSTYTLTDDEIGDQVFVRVTYTDGAGREHTLKSPLSTVVVNTNDSLTGTVMISGTAAEGARLTADASGLSDEDGLRKFSYTWLADGTPISGATSSTLTLTQALVGAQISVSVAYTDRFGTAESVTSGDTFAVSNVNDAPTGAVLIEGTKEQGETLAVNTSGLADADGLGSFSYNWQRDGEDISGATASTYELVQADVGSVISVSVSYTDGFGTDEEATSSPTKKIIGELILTGNGGSNRLVGGKFDDTLNGRNGNDVLKGRAGDDDLVGGKGADKLLGGSGVDKLKGDAGSDILKGGSGADNLIGGSKNDDLYGGGGNDELSGSGGRDFLKGQKGDDTLTGGKGADTFFFKKGDGQDVITDFTVGADVIEIGKGANRIRQLDFEQVDEDVLVSFRNVEILVENILIEDLKDTDNFLF